MIKINFKGGNISTGALNNLITLLDKTGVEAIKFGQRQNAFIQVNEAAQFYDCLLEKGFDFEIDKNEYPNIVSSYVSEDVFTSHPWVSEGMYRDILESFNYKQKLKINIVDPTQGIIPLFTGNINIICSKSENFWYLYVKHVSLDGMQLYPKLIYTTEIGLFCQQLEAELQTNKGLNLSQIAERIDKKYSYISTNLTDELKLGRIRFPHYEGVVSYDSKFWLGIYRRNNDFSKELLREISDLCAQTKIAEVHIMPWQTLAIKGIAEADRILWEKLLGKFGVNIRHSALELNWQLPDLDNEAQELKKYLVRLFDEHDIRTYGLSFSVKTKSMEVSTSVIIEKRNGEESFNILYAEDFNPNQQKYVVYSEEVVKGDLVYVLERLCRKYYEQLNSSQDKVAISNSDKHAHKNTRTIMQCKHCFTVYDSTYGDIVNDINPGVSFAELPESFCCSICEAPKADFVSNELSLVP
jgi:rubredoxin